MPHAPVNNFSIKNLPGHERAGAFWENRGDRRHCGVDIYAPPGEPVFAVNDGVCIETGLFTSPELNPYWNQTYFVIIQTADGHFVKYAEMRDIYISAGERIRSGDRIGEVGRVINPDAVDKSAPEYIRRLAFEDQSSMLHLEVYSANDYILEDYLGGNYFGIRRPAALVDPIQYLSDLLK
ncbi:MAG: M23 family metallopeptidase [Candidatus Kapaibacterium sp.]